MCASPLSPRHAQPDWMGGGLESRQMMHAPPSAGSPRFQFESSSVWSPWRWQQEVRSRAVGMAGISRVLPYGRAKKWPGSEAPSHRWYGQQLRWSRRGPRVALEWSLYRLSMRYDADRRRGHLVSRKRNRQTGALVPDAIAMGYGCHCSHCRCCGGCVGQSRRHDQEGGVSIVGEAGPRRGRQDPSDQDCCSRSTACRAPAYGHPRRSEICTHLCSAERVAHSPRTRQNEW